MAAWEFGGWRPYVGGFYLLSGDPDGLKKPGWHAGVDYARQCAGACSARDWSAGST